ncbi:MAG: hypothetical protein V5B39_06830 [Accumulibacter sp.]
MAAPGSPRLGDRLGFAPAAGGVRQAERLEQSGIVRRPGIRPGA